MTFEDVEELSLAAEFYMFSSQVDGEQDLLIPSPKSRDNTISPSQMVNGISHNVNGASQSQSNSSGAIKTEPLMGQVLLNGGGINSESSILARHLSLGVVTKVNLEAGPEKLYSCDMCSAKLKNKRNFETHMKRHRGELPFRCDECPKTFQGRRDLDTHKRSRHDPSRRVRMETDMSLLINRPATVTSNVDAAAASTVYSTASSTPSVSSVSKTVVLSMNGFSGFSSGKHQLISFSIMQQLRILLASDVLFTKF